METGEAAGGALAANPFVRRVAETLLDELAPLTEDLYRRIVSEDPFYASVADTMGDEIRAAIEEHFGQLLRSLAGREALDFDLPRELARRRAEQGVPVASLLHSYRLASQVVLDQFAAAGYTWAGRDDGRDTVLDGIIGLYPLINAYSSVITETYDDMVTDRARRSERERTLLLDALLEGRTQDLPLVGDAARILDLPERGKLLVVVAETAAPGDEGLPGIEQALRLRAIRSAWRLRSQRHLGIVVSGSSRGSEASVDDIRSTLESRAVGRVGVSPAYRELADTAHHVTLADIALNCLPPGDKGVALFDQHPLTTLLAGSPALAERSAHRILGPILDLPGDERQMLLGTLSTWIDEGGSATRAAARLFCHRNTVRNRLQRVERLTGRSLDEPTALAEICVAVRAVALLPFPDEAVGPAATPG